MKEFKSFYKKVEGNEGQKCHYSTRLDTYGCGCFHDCKYCYAKSLLGFRDLWHPEDPSVADINKIENKIKLIPKGSILRLGGMTDCFQPCEAKYKVTYRTIQLLNKYGIHYLIVTKSNMIASDEYMKILDKNLAHIQITVTSTDDKTALTYEQATPSSERIKAIEKLNSNGFDVAIRVSPFIPEYIDFNILNNIKCKKVVVEFLRVNGFIKRTFDLDYSQYIHKEGGYYHLPLKIKKELISKINGFEQISVCEDCDEAYNFWKANVNYNPSDCCNLTFNNKRNNYIGNLELLNCKKIGFLSSQRRSLNTINKINEWIKTIDDDTSIVSGFQSKNESELLDMLLNQNKKIIMVLSREIYDKCPKKFESAVNSGRMLIISPYDEMLKVTTRDNARIRNQFVFDTSDEIVIGDLTVGGMLDGMLKGKTFKLLGEKL